MLSYTTCLQKFRVFPSRFLVFTARLSLAAFFIRAGQTKLDGFNLSSGAQYLFQEEYKVPLLPWDVAAWLAIGAEHIFSILLILGLATRLSALGLLGMTLIIQFFVYPGSWPDHLMWATLLMLIVARGPGAFSLDNRFNKKLLS
jgi:putative oxidoreductase